MVYGPIHYDGDGGNIIVPFNNTDPATGLPFDNVAVTATTYDLLDLTTTPATSLATGAGVWDSVAETWKFTLSITDLSGLRTALLVITPTRAASTPPALWPTTSIPLDVTDIVKRQDDIETKVDTADTAISDLSDQLSTHDAAVLAAISALALFVGDTDDPAGTTSTGTVAAKLNALLALFTEGAEHRLGF